jgi:chromosome segregation ATPase
MAAQNTDISQKEEEYKSIYAKAYSNRTEINKSLKECQRILNESGLYVWDAENKVYVESADYATHVNIEAEAPKDRIALDKKFAEAELRNQQLQNGKGRVAELENEAGFKRHEIKRIEDEILRLQAQLETEKQKLTATEENIQKGKTYVEERKDAEKEYTEIRKEVMDYGNIETLRKMLAESKQTLDNYTTYEQAKMECEAIMDTCEADLKVLTQKYTPPIEGLEVIVANIDSAKPEGVYYKGTNIAHLCESELWDLCLQVWKCTGIRVVFIENSSSLGSDAVQRINWFANNGGYVFITTMQRGYKELKVSFHKELK